MEVGKFNPFIITSSVLLVVAVVFYNRLDSNDSINVEQSEDSFGTRVTSTLKFVVIVARHGKRGPYLSCPKCPYQGHNRTYWPYGKDELTNNGRVQMHNFGLKLRSLYNGFLSQLYLQEEFIALSTNSSRSMMSAALVLAGLFPPTGFQIWKSSIPWQPIPIFKSENDHTAALVTGKLCPKYQEETKKTQAKFEDEYRTEITALITSLQPYTGTTVESGSLLLSLMAIWESLHHSEQDTYPLPTWSKSVYPEPLETLSNIALKAFLLGSDTKVRLSFGLLFQEIMGLMEAKVNGTPVPDRKMVYYSGHDATIMGLQAMLGLPDSDTPLVKTGSALIYELHKDQLTNQHYVQILYLDGGMPDLEPRVVNMPSCAFPCNFDTIKALTEKYYNITDYVKECEKTA